VGEPLQRELGDRDDDYHPMVSPCIT
jgi:hypothetical protein